MKTKITCRYCGTSDTVPRMSERDMKLMRCKVCDEHDRLEYKHLDIEPVDYYKGDGEQLEFDFGGGK